MPKKDCIKEVLLKGGQHFIVRKYDPTDPMASKYGAYELDPWTGKKVKIGTYPFKSYRLFDFTKKKEGIDVSHHNIIDWKKVNTDFVIMKATQGVLFVDSELKTNREGSKNIQQGFYHFADGGDWKKEAKHFLETIGKVKNEWLVLDWEIDHESPVEWCSGFLSYVEKKTGIRPFLYTNEARVLRYNWEPCTKYPLWIAKYGTNNGLKQKEPNTGAWDNYKIWQYTSRGKIDGIAGFVDLNIF